VAVFIASGLHHFDASTIANTTAKRMPMAGAWPIVAFRIPATLMMHNFRTVADPMMPAMQRAIFNKNLVACFFLNLQ